MRLEAAHLGDLLRISVRTSTKTPRGPLSDFQGPRGNHGRRRSERRSSRSRPYLPASGFQGRTTLIEKRELFPDSPAASPSSFRLPGRGTRHARRSRRAALRTPNTRERFRAGFRNTDRIPFRPTYDRDLQFFSLVRAFRACAPSTRPHPRSSIIARAFAGDNPGHLIEREQACTQPRMRSPNGPSTNTRTTLDRESIGPTCAVGHAPAGLVRDDAVACSFVAAARCR